MDDPGTSSNLLQSIQGAWSVIVTMLGALIFWNGRRLVKQLDEKANQKDFEDHKTAVESDFKAMQDTINRIVDNQQKQHNSNTERLDKILSEVYRSRGHT